MNRPARASRPDPVAFVRDNTRLTPVPGLPAIRLHTAHEATGLWRLREAGEDGSDPPAPYWAFPWAGGMALARHMCDRPEIVAGRSVLDLGSGSGLVAIAAAKAEAARVEAADTDRYALAAIELNAAANDVSVTTIASDITGEAAPAVDVVLVGDLFYERALADRVMAFLDRCLVRGSNVFIGDPRRAYLPAPRLRLLAEYAVPDVGDVEGSAANPGAVFALELAG